MSNTAFIELQQISQSTAECVIPTLSIMLIGKEKVKQNNDIDQGSSNHTFKFLFFNVEN